MMGLLDKYKQDKKSPRPVLGLLDYGNVDTSVDRTIETSGGAQKLNEHGNPVGAEKLRPQTAHGAGYVAPVAGITYGVRETTPELGGHEVSDELARAFAELRRQQMMAVMYGMGRMV